MDILAIKTMAKINQKSTKNQRRGRSALTQNERYTMTDMTEQELQEAYDAHVAEVFDALDAVHVALVDLQNVKKEIQRQAVALGMVDPNNPQQDGPGKNQAKRIEAAAVLSVDNVATLHMHILTARTQLIGTSPNVDALGEAGLIVYDWQSEFNGIIPTER